MCLYPKLIENRKYKPTKKNGGIVPPLLDPRTAFVPIGCGKCIECKKQRASNWRIRLMEDIRTNKIAKFVTMTFSDESLVELEEEVKRINKKQHDEIKNETGRIKEYIEIEGYELENAIATMAVRRFLERWRWEYKTSVRHWLVTELGQEKTERIHIHGIIWTNVNKPEVEKLWKYGTVNRMQKNWENNYV